MSDDGKTLDPQNGDAAPKRELSPAAKRALAEAEERRKRRPQHRLRSRASLAGRKAPSPRVTAIGGKRGGIVSDF